MEEKTKLYEESPGTTSSARVAFIVSIIMSVVLTLLALVLELFFPAVSLLDKIFNYVALFFIAAWAGKDLQKFAEILPMLNMFKKKDE